ncbi:MAG TPA: peptidase M23 [Bacilli bacterium]
MSEAIKTLLLFYFTFILWVLQINLQMDAEAHYKLKESLEIAAHDAALQDVEAELAEGRIVFNTSQALESFKDSLIYSLKLTDAGMALEPMTQSYFQDPIRIVFEHYIDDGNTISYPFLYENPTYNIREVIRGPSVIFIVETQTPRHFRGQKKEIRKRVVYEYPQQG